MEGLASQVVVLEVGISNSQAGHQALVVLLLAGQTKGKLVFYMVSFLCIISCINHFNSRLCSSTSFGGNQQGGFGSNKSGNTFGSG